MRSQGDRIRRVTFRSVKPRLEPDSNLGETFPSLEFNDIEREWWHFSRKRLRNIRFRLGGGRSRIIRSCRNRIMVSESVRSVLLLPPPSVALSLLPFARVTRGLAARANARCYFSEKQSARFHGLRCRMLRLPYIRLAPRRQLGHGVR